MKQHVSTSHCSRAAIHELEMHDFVMRFIGEAGSVPDIPLIEKSLRVAKLFQPRFSVCNSCGETVSLTFEVSLPDEVYDVGVVQSVDPVSYTHLTLPTNREV